MPPFPINIPSSNARLGSVDSGVLTPELYSVYGNQGRGGAGPRPLQPTEGMLKFAAEQQKQQQLQTLAQQYGDDYDGLVQAWGQVDPEGAMRMGQELEKHRQEAAKTTVEQSKATAAKLDDASLFIKAAIAKPEVYPSVRAAAVSKYGDYAEQFLPPVGDPDLETHLGTVLQVMNQHADFVKTRAEAAQLYADGKKVEGVLTNMAGTTTPDQLALAVKDAKMMGLGDVATQAVDAAGAQAMLAKRQALAPEKPGTEKGGQAKEGIYQGKRTFGVFDPNTNTFMVDGKQVSASEFRPIAPQAAGGGGGAGGLSTGEGGGLELAGTMTRLLGRIPVGMARSGNPSAIMNEAARQNKILGQTPVGMMQKAAMYQSDKKALDQMTKMASAAYAYENKAQAQLDIVDSLSDKVWRTKSPLINRAILAGQTEIAGDKDATLLLNAITTASTEYAKIMMGGTASAAAITDSAQKEAQKLLSAGMSKGTLKGATALMRTEMGLTNKGYDAAIAHINEGLGGQPQSAAPQTPLGPYDVQAPNGKTYHFTSQAQSDAFKKQAGIQ